MAEIMFKSGGALSTIQDLGRIGYQQIGMPVAGVMDSYAARLANIIVGNEESAALIEATLLGPEIEVRGDCLVAITGADMNAAINNIKIALWKSYRVKAGDIIKLSGAIKGLRSYLAFSGGVLGDEIMESRSTYLKGGIGGFSGRAIKAGDIVKIGDMAENIINELDSSLIAQYGGDEISIKAVAGPNDEKFTQKSKDLFFSQEYKIGARSDRMGIFLEGETLEFSGESADILSSAILMGSIQVANDGLPIILMADRQTTGGYAQIATVITPDLYKLAQAMPGTKVRFQQVTVDEAMELYNAYEKNFIAAKQLRAKGSQLKSVSFKELNLDGVKHRAIVEEVM